MSKTDAKQLVHSKRYSPRRGAIEVDAFDPLTVKVLWAQVLVKRDMEEQQTEGGLYKPDIALEPKFTGLVISKGPDCTNDSIKPGCRVMFSKYSGAEIEIEEIFYALMSESDILAIIPTEVRTDRVD